MQIADNLSAFPWEDMRSNNCNTYLIDGPSRVLIDPGHAAFFGHVEAQLEALKIIPDDIGLVICTHCHPDHIEAVSRFADKPALFAIHAQEWQLIRQMDQYLKSFGMTPEVFEPDFFLQEGELDIKGTRLDVFHVPGHSPGSVALYWGERKALFTGDLIFAEGVGRTDLPGGNGTQLKESICRLRDLDVEHLLPGHGPVVSGKDAIGNVFEQLEAFWFDYI